MARRLPPECYPGSGLIIPIGLKKERGDGQGGYHTRTVLPVFCQNGCSVPVLSTLELVPESMIKESSRIRALQNSLYSFCQMERLGIFEKIFTALSENAQDMSLFMMGATYLKVHRPAANLKKGCSLMYRTNNRGRYMRSAMLPGVRFAHCHGPVSDAVVNTAVNAGTSCCQGS